MLFNIGVDPEATYVQNYQDTDLITYYDEGVIEDEKKVSIFYDGKIYPGDEVKFDVLFEMTFGEKTETGLIGLDNDNQRRLQDKNGNKEITFLKSFNISLCLADVDCKEGDENYGIQKTNLQHKITFRTEQRAVGSISLKSENIGTELMPEYVLTAVIENVDSSYDVSKVIYSFKRKIEGKDNRFIEIALTENDTISDIPFKEGEIDEKKQYKVTYKVIGEFPDGRTLDSLTKNKVIFNYVIEDDGEDKDKNDGLPLYTIVINVIEWLLLLQQGF